jgi:hypothetical protein
MTMPTRAKFDPMRGPDVIREIVVYSSRGDVDVISAAL